MDSLLYRRVLLEASLPPTAPSSPSAPASDYLETPLKYEALCGTVSPPPGNPPCAPPPPNAPPPTNALPPAGAAGMADMNIGAIASAMSADEDNMRNALNSKLADAAGESMGCRVDDLLGSSMPTFLSAWASLLTVLFIQSLDNFAKAEAKLRKMLFDYLEKQRWYQKVMKWYARYKNAKAKMTAAKAKAKRISSKINETQDRLEKADGTFTEVQNFVDEEEDIIGRVQREAEEKARAEAEEAKARVKAEVETAREKAEVVRGAVEEPTDKDISKLKEKVKAYALKKLASAKATATAFKVVNLTITIVTFILAVWTASSWKVCGHKTRCEDRFLVFAKCVSCFPLLLISLVRCPVRCLTLLACCSPESARPIRNC